MYLIVCVRACVRAIVRACVHLAPSQIPPLYCIQQFQYVVLVQQLHCSRQGSILSNVCFTLILSSSQGDSRKIDDELDRQDRNLKHFRMNRVAVMPDENCLFSAVCVAGKLEMDCFDLRRTIAEYIAGNINDFNKFMSIEQGGTLLDNMSNIAEELKMMKAGGYWVGYESIMALSRHLGAVILVTSGGTSDNDTVRTDSFYFGENRPEKRIHIVWVSVGFYDAVVPTTGAAGSQVFGHRRPVEDNLLPQNKRHPIHVCQCKWACDCKNWQEVYTFPENPAEPASHVNSSPASSRSTQSANTSSQESFWRKVFKYLSKQAPVMQNWKFVMRHLHLCEGTIVRVDDEHKKLNEKVYNALIAWRQESETGATMLALQEALREENLNLVAGTTHFIPSRHVLLCSTWTDQRNSHGHQCI